MMYLRASSSVRREALKGHAIVATEIHNLRSCWIKDYKPLTVGAMFPFLFPGSPKSAASGRIKNKGAFLENYERLMERERQYAEDIAKKEERLAKEGTTLLEHWGLN